MNRPSPSSRCEMMQLTCPACGELTRWYPTWIYSRSFDGRCRTCAHQWSSPLPPLNMKLVVLDTNATSELMKVSNPDYPEKRRARVPPLWKDVLSRLTTASRLHEVACPRTPTLDRGNSSAICNDRVLSGSPGAVSVPKTALCSCYDCHRGPPFRRSVVLG